MELGIIEALGLSVLGICIVFIVLILLMIVIHVMNYLIIVHCVHKQNVINAMKQKHMHYQITNVFQLGMQFHIVSNKWMVNVQNVLVVILLKMMNVPNVMTIV